MSFLLRIGLETSEVTSERKTERERDTDEYPLDILNPKVACSKFRIKINGDVCAKNILH